MTHDFPSIPASHKPDTSWVAEESQSFVAFDRWMDRQLGRLVARWIHAAAPNAHRVWRNKAKGPRR